MEKNEKKKRKGCLIFALILLGIFLWYNSASIKAQKENKYRAYMAVTLKNSIENYFKQHQQYPENVSILSLQNKETIEEYVKAGVLGYAKDSSGKEWFTLTCRYTGILKRGNSSHGLSWSGIQYSNRVDRLPLPAGQPPEADKTGFYLADFH
jgi:hypothetical protein